MKATSATPLIKPPTFGLVWLDGKLSTTVVRKPWGLILEMRAPVALAVYGPTGGTTCSQAPSLEFNPPVPPSATYRDPSGPNFRPRGLFKPVAKTETVDAAGIATSSAASAALAFHEGT